MIRHINTFKSFLNENSEVRYRIVADYGHGDKLWVSRNLTEDGVRDYYINRGWTKEEFDEVGIQHFMDSDFTYYVEIDDPDEEEEKD